MTFSIDMRIDMGRCIHCSRLTDAYFCDECAMDSTYAREDDRRGPTASQVSRSMQRRVDAGAAYDQMLDLQTVIDPGVLPVEGCGRVSPRPPGGLSATGRARKLRALNRRESGGFGHVPIVPGIPRAARFNSPLKTGRRAEHWWNAWIRFWGGFGFKLVDDLTRPEGIDGNG